MSSLNESGILITAGEHLRSTASPGSTLGRDRDASCSLAGGRERREGDLIVCLGESKCPLKAKKSREIGL